MRKTIVTKVTCGTCGILQAHRVGDHMEDPDGNRLNGDAPLICPHCHPEEHIEYWGEKGRERVEKLQEALSWYWSKTDAEREVIDEIRSRK